MSSLDFYKLIESTDLSEGEALELLEKGKLFKYVRSYKRKEQRRREGRRNIDELNFCCPVCEREIIDYDLWTLGGTSCLECSRKREGKPIVRERCTMCKELRAKFRSFADTRICQNCYRKVNRILNNGEE